MEHVLLTQDTLLYDCNNGPSVENAKIERGFTFIRTLFSKPPRLDSHTVFEGLRSRYSGPWQNRYAAIYWLKNCTNPRVVVFSTPRITEDL